MGKLKDRFSAALYKIRNPEYDEREDEFKRQLGTKRLLFFLPFLIAAILFWLLYYR
jgi:hypothetical protein